MIPDRSPQSLIFLTIWSGLFTKVFGFSFLTLNFAVLTLSVIGVIFFVLLLQEVAPESSKLLPLAAYLFNPIFFAVAGVYLTDAPFVSLLLLAMYFFIRAYRRESVAWALAGSLVVGCAFLIRQYGVLLAVAAAVPFFMLKVPRQRPRRAALITATLAPTFVIVILFFLWLGFRHGVPSEFRVYQLEFLNVPRVLWSVLGVPFFGGLYMGLFLSPLLLTEIFQRSREEKWLWVFYSLLLASVAVILAVRGGPLPYMWNNVMPYWGSILLVPASRTFWNILTAWCVIGAGAGFARLTVWLMDLVRSGINAGDETRRSRYLSYLRAGLYSAVTLLLLLSSGLPRRPSIKAGEWIVTWIYHNFGGAGGRHTFPLTHWINQVPTLYASMAKASSLILLFAASNLLYAYLTVRRRTKEGGEPSVTPQPVWVSHSLVMLGAFVVICSVFLILFWTRFDRYLLILVPSTVLLLWSGKVRSGNGLLSAVVMILLAAIATGNAYMGITQSKNLWNGGQYLLAQGIPPERIRGSHGFNAWYLYDLRGQRKPDDPTEWWVIGEDYVVDVTRRPGYEVIKELPYWNCFRLTKEAIYVMKRVEPR